MFKGRKKELELLEDLYDSKQYEFLVLYGRSTAHLELKAFDSEKQSIKLQIIIFLSGFTFYLRRKASMKFSGTKIPQRK